MKIGFSLLFSLGLLSTVVLADDRTANRGIMNPDLSLDGLFSLTQFSQANPLVFATGHDPRQSGFNIQQVEMTFGANVDPYFRLDANLVVTAEGIEIEEAYGTSLDFPAGLQLKAGQFFTAFGRMNPVHPHAWEFANKPIVLGRFFGGDGMRNPGAQISWLTPLPWYSELIASIQNSNGETALSFRPEGNASYDPTPGVSGAVAGMRSLTDALSLLRTNNFVSLSDDWSLNLGASYLNGANAFGASHRTQIFGGDFYLRFRQPDSMSFITLQFEYLRRAYGSPTGSLADSGWYTQLVYRLPGAWQRWHLGLRFDSANMALGPTNASPGLAIVDSSERWRVSPAITFYPSEFSRFRMQYDYDKLDTIQVVQHAAHLQFEVLIGAHGAHKF